MEGKLQRGTADQLSYSQRSVSNVLKKPRLTGSVRDLKIPGRKKKNYEEKGPNHGEKSKSNRSNTAPEN